MDKYQRVGDCAGPNMADRCEPIDLPSSAQGERQTSPRAAIFAQLVPTRAQIAHFTCNLGSLVIFSLAHVLNLLQIFSK